MVVCVGSHGTIGPASLDLSLLGQVSFAVVLIAKLTIALDLVGRPHSVGGCHSTSTRERSVAVSVVLEVLIRLRAEIGLDELAVQSISIDDRLSVLRVLMVASLPDDQATE